MGARRIRTFLCGRVIFGAFSQAAPERLPAAPAGNNCIVNVMTTNEKTGKIVIAAVNPVVGGGGGMPHRDGTNGSGAECAGTKIDCNGETWLGDFGFSTPSTSDTCNLDGGTCALAARIVAVSRCPSSRNIPHRI